jgi:hypothetical protein
MAVNDLEGVWVRNREVVRGNTHKGACDDPKDSVPIIWRECNKRQTVFLVQGMNDL